MTNNEVQEKKEVQRKRDAVEKALASCRNEYYTIHISFLQQDENSLFQYFCDPRILKCPCAYL